MARRMRLMPPILVEGSLCLMWAIHVQAISFLEAWVKFQAPTLRSHVAVDVGRHVFRALHAVELALSTCVGFVWVAQRMPWRQQLLPVSALGCLWSQLLFVMPKLEQRAQKRIVTALQHHQQAQNEHNTKTVPSVLKLSRREQDELVELETRQTAVPLPSAKWHLVYVGLELIKLVSLVTHVLGAWSRIPRHTMVMGM